MSDIPEQDVEEWIREQKKRGAHIIPMGDKVTTLERTITEQMDYKDAIMRQIDQCRWALLYGYSVFSTNVVMLLNMIPEEDKDEQFNEDIENAKVGVITWKKSGGRNDVTRKEIYVKVESPDYFALFRACINLFRRRGMLWGESKAEVI